MFCVSSSQCHELGLESVIVIFPGPEVMLNSTEHDIYRASKYKIDLEYLMLHAKFKDNRTFGCGEDF